MNTEDLRVAAATPPDYRARQTFLCRRCGAPFTVHGIKRHCTGCTRASTAAGITGSESIGEVSGT